MQLWSAVNPISCVCFSLPNLLFSLQFRVKADTINALGKRRMSILLYREPVPLTLLLVFQSYVTVASKRNKISLSLILFILCSVTKKEDRTITKPSGTVHRREEKSSLRFCKHGVSNRPVNLFFHLCLCQRCPFTRSVQSNYPVLSALPMLQ